MDDDARDRFATWLRERLDVPEVWLGAVERPAAGGLSSETWLVDADWGAGPRGIVVRLPPSGPGLFPDYDLGRQAAAMEALRQESTVPVPTVLWYEDDTSVLGRPFIVMDRVPGRIPSDNPGYHFAGWLHDLDAEGQRVIFENSVEVLAAIHRVDWRRAGLESSLREGLDAELDYWDHYLDWATDSHGDGAGRGRAAIVDAALRWCVEHRPVESPSALVWGDTRLGNIVYDDDGAVRAVLDWEMATLGPPELDLGWYLFIERTALQFAPQLAGFPGRADTIAAYERALGRSVVDIDWYELWGGVRSAAIMIRVAGNLAELGMAPETFAFDNPVTRLLETMLAQR